MLSCLFFITAAYAQQYVTVSGSTGTPAINDNYDKQVDTYNGKEWFINRTTPSYCIAYIAPSSPAGFLWAITNTSDIQASNDNLAVSHTYYYVSFATSGDVTPDPPQTGWNDGGGPALGIAVSLVLPVEMTSFTASAKGHAIVLQWNTATEKNNYGFEIERRAVATSGAQATAPWTKLGFAEGHGTTNAPQSYSYVDNSAAGSYAYRLKQIDKDGRFEYSKAVEGASTLSPADYSLTQNYPNPFNPTTNIHFMLKATQHASLKVYNTIGQEVATLFDGIAEGNMMQTVSFDASRMSSGMYFYTLRSGEKTEVKKMQLLR
jgi:hypothetical protein